jgi:hypothetical protein
LLVVGAIILAIGINVASEANALFARTQSAVATVDLVDRQLHFTTWGGQQVSAPLITDCKESQRPPRTGCIARFEQGDQVLISYDAEEPSHVWVGNTPGGGTATLLLAVGVAMLVAGGLVLWWTWLQPRIQSFFSGTAQALPQRRAPDDRRH